MRSSIITLQDDVTVYSTLHINKNITIQSDGTARSISPGTDWNTYYTSIFSVESGTLTLGDGQAENSLLFQGFEWLKGNTIIANNSRSTLVIKEGVTASDLKVKTFATNEGTMIIEGGTFSNNEVSKFIRNSGSITMTGGNISDNHSIENEVEPSVIDNENNGNIQINGGTIQNNDMLGVVNRGKLTFSDGFITGNRTDIILDYSRNLIISGSAETTSIYLKNLYNYIQIEDNLLDESIIVKLDGYSNGREILRGISSILESNYEKFVVENTNYSISKTGKLEYSDTASSIYYVGGVDADDEAAGTTKEAPFSSLEYAVGVIGSNSATIILQSDVTINNTILISGNISIISDGTRRTIFRGNEAMNTMFSVNGKLILGNSDYSGSDTLPDLLLDGNSGMGITANGSIINNLGELFIFPGTVLQNNENTSYEEEHNSVVLNNGGDFYMYGGVIKSNTSTGATIINKNNAKFIMKEGSIKNNKASEISGVFVDNRSNFLMEGGSIRNNRGGSSGVVVYMESEFTMKGGTISGNNDGKAVIGVRKINIAVGAGVNIIEGSAFIMEDGTISNNSDSEMAGVNIVDSTFHMTGGNIIDNTGSKSAGVILGNTDGSDGSNSSFTMDGGNISGNVGIMSGIYGEYTNIIMNDGTISNNIGIQGSGILTKHCYVTMNGGVISENMADIFSGIGINIMVDVNEAVTNDILSLNGGVIQQNKATLNGVYSMNKILMSGKGIITGGDKVIFPILPIGFGFEFEVGIELNGSVPTISPDIEVVLYQPNLSNNELKFDIPVGEQIIYSGSGYNYTWEDVSKFKLTSPEYAINLEGRIGKALKENWVTLSDTSRIYYEGKEKTVEIKVFDGGVELIRDLDYTVSYSNNTQVGDAEVTITGTGNYSGKVYHVYTIKPLELSEEWVSLIDTSKIIYEGKEKTVEITVFNGVVELIRDLDYTVSYLNNTQVGDAEVNITGIGNYSGKVYLGFAIEPLELSDEWVALADTSKIYYDGKEKTVEITVFNGVDELIKDVDYTVSYSNNTEIGDAEVTITGIGNYADTIIREFTILKKPVLPNYNPPNYNPPIIPVLLPEEIAPIVVSVTEGKLTIEVNHITEETIEDQKEEIILTIPSEELVEQITKEEVTDVNIKLKADDQLFSNSKKKKNILLKAEILEASKDAEKNISVSVKDQNGRERYTWYFNSNELNTSLKDPTDVNLYLEVLEMELTEEITNNHEDQGVGLMLDFHHEGELPSQASVRVYVGDKKDIKPGSRIYLYHINESTGMLETLPFSAGYQVDAEGYIQVDILHCSDYMMLNKEASTDLISSLRNQISVTIDKLTMYAGGDVDSTAQITVTLPPTLEILESLMDDTSQKAIGGVTVSYRSSNEKVASVDGEGRISAKKKGKAIIYATVTLYSSKTKVVVFKVNVKEPYIKLVKSIGSMELGSSIRFKAEAYGLDIEDLIWTTKRKSTVVIKKDNGMARATSKGTDYVIATINDVSKEIKVVVK
ncbi:MAG TPA: hypothetical protein VJ888_00275 [Mobilitalea sp.]|nr:hypothetical protein [Mobilitalea sp.]